MGWKMTRALFLENDIQFIIKAQKLLPKGTEWLSTTDIKHAEELIKTLAFDMIIVRKKNQDILKQFLTNIIQESSDKNFPAFKQIVVLPQFCWSRYMKKELS